MSDLLKVLDMTEEERQLRALYKQGYLRAEIGIYTLGPHNNLKKYELIKGSLADLAFRLRDEARKKDLGAWNNAIYIVACHINESPLSDYGGCVPDTAWQWAQHIILNQDEYPLWIIWIIAALIANKEK